jgi:hypothetical protein
MSASYWVASLSIYVCGEAALTPLQGETFQLSNQFITLRRQTARTTGFTR